MARKASVILTPAEKKQAVNTAKEAAKAAGRNLSDLAKARKALDAEYAKAVKAHEKELAAAQKVATAADAELLKLNPPKAEPTPTE